MSGSGGDGGQGKDSKSSFSLDSNIAAKNKEGRGASKRRRDEESLNDNSSRAEGAKRPMIESVSASSVVKFKGRTFNPDDPDKKNWQVIGPQKTFGEVEGANLFTEACRQHAERHAAKHGGRWDKGPIGFEFWHIPAKSVKKTGQLAREFKQQHQASAASGYRFDSQGVDRSRDSGRSSRHGNSNARRGRGGGRGGGRRQNKRPQMTHEQLDQEMADYWSSVTAPTTEGPVTQESIDDEMN
ncbi:hypothetical protein PG985_010407 [Apiospora marii]|uniref:Chromatin target of PRMT1 protein C-terminal domain-containing protein n=1 Tax=Apiospora marii TaxID=335849 RepID=A0ABR1RZ61_9PEZI